MKQSEGEALAKRIVHFYENVANRSIIDTCRHFMKEGIWRLTIKRIIARYEKRGTVEYSHKSGRTPKISTKKTVAKVKKIFESDPNKSVRACAEKLQLTKSTVSDIKVKKLGVKARRKETVPKYSGDQESRAKSACRKLYRNRGLSTGAKILIMDDETYVPVDPDQVPGIQFYHSKDKSEVPDKNRFKGKSKFPKKYLVWQCIDENGNVSDPFITTGTINAKIYLKECLIKRLKPFIEKHHELNSILFWPDMASSHYASQVTTWLENEKIDFVAKNDNAPNVPQARPIERFWALCKKAYKKRAWPAKSLSSFKRIWKNIAIKVANDSAQSIMKGAKMNLRAIGYGGVLAPFKKL